MDDLLGLINGIFDYDETIVPGACCINPFRALKYVPQGLKPAHHQTFAARLKPRPFKTEFMQQSLVH
jgi:hypothetical protein